MTMPWRLLAVLVPVLLALPARGSAQPRWSVEASVSLAKDLRHDNGPSLGAAGAEATLFFPSASRWRWGASLAWQRFGRFGYDFQPGFHVDRSALIASVRRRRSGFILPALYADLGLGVALGMEKHSIPADDDTSRDLGLGGQLGIGVRSPGGGPFAEIGLRGILVHGESTDTGGIYPTVKIGLMF